MNRSPEPLVRTGHLMRQDLTPSFVDFASSGPRGPAYGPTLIGSVLIRTQRATPPHISMTTPDNSRMRAKTTKACSEDSTHGSMLTAT